MIAAVALCAVLIPARVALAHQPVMLDDKDEWPELGPELVDGTVSFAVYGVIDKPGATRGVAFNLKQGDQLFVQLLIPSLEPEMSRTLPTITVLDPDGVPTDPLSTLGDAFLEPFSRTSYRYVAEVSTPAVKTGSYGVVITNSVPGRFTVAIGNREVGGEVRRNDATGDLTSWYATATPDVPAAVARPASTTVPGAASSSASSAAPSTVSTVPPAATVSPDAGKSSRRWMVAVAAVLLAGVVLIAGRGFRSK